ncbi:MAG: MOSC domain-containing protein [bacterium]
MSHNPTDARVAGLQRSGGGVPKLPIAHALVSLDGVAGDWQFDRKHHGGRDRALCLYSADLIDALASEGHPISPGAMGENVTIRAMDWSVICPGTRLLMGSVEAEVTAYAAPCNTIAAAFCEGKFTRVSQKVHPGWSRVYARVLQAGGISLEDEVRVIG